MLGKLRFRLNLVILTDALAHSSSSDEPSSRPSAGRRSPPWPWSSPKQLVDTDDDDDDVDKTDDAAGEHHGASGAAALRWPWRPPPLLLLQENRPTPALGFLRNAAKPLEVLLGGLLPPPPLKP